MLANKHYKGGIFVNCLHFCCIIIYYSHSLIHQLTIPVTHRVIFLTKCDQEKYFHVALIYFWGRRSMSVDLFSVT